MSILSKHPIRYALALLGMAVAAGCSSEGDGGTEPGAIALVLLPTSATIQQGGSAAVAGTLTRSGGFTGTVNLTVTGAPTGVTAVVSNVVTTGLVTTATITINVALTATVGGPTTLVVHGTGTGVTEATANFALTITAAPTPAYTLTLSASTLSIVQGGSTPTTTVTLVRTNFTANVALSVDNLPTGVTAGFNPASPISGNTSVLTLTVSPTATLGTFSNLAVRGVATGLTDQTASLTLTITAPGSFTLAVTPAGGVTLVQGTSDNSKTITITRNSYAAAITLTAEGLPTGVTAAFAGSPTTGNSSVLTLTAAAGATVGGPVTVTIRGTGPAALRVPGDFADVEATTTLQLTVTAAVVGNFSLTTTPATNFSLAQGASGDVTVNIARTGGFTGSVNLTVTGLVTGLTALFTPASAPGATSTLTLTAAGSLAVGPYPIVIRGNFTGLGEQTVNLNVNVTVAGNFSLTTTPATNFSLTQGTTGNVTVNINRTGGFTGSVNLTVTGLVTGLTALFTPASAPGATSTLALTATGGLAVGPYPIVIRGNFTGLTEQTVNLTVNVTAPGGSGNVTLTWASCAVADKAVWVAYQDGTAGAWIKATAAPADVYQFNITQSKGGIAYVVVGSGTATVTVLYFSQAELTAGVLNFCAVAPSGKNVNVTLANVGAGKFGFVSFGGAFNFSFGADGVLPLTNVRDGLNDLVGYSHVAGGGASDRMFFSRGLNPPNGGSVGTVDFTGAGSFAPQSATATVSGLTGGETAATQSMSYYTSTAANACVAATLYQSQNTTSSFLIYGAPVANQVATDFHSFSIFAISGGTAFRSLTEDFKVLTTRAASPFVLPAALPAVTPTILAGPYKRLQVATTFAAELNSSATFTYADQTVVGTTVLLSATAGWLGGTAVTLGMPDFSVAVGGGFQNSWAPGSGDTVSWSLTGSGSTLTPCTEGHKTLIANRSGTA